MCRKLYRTYFCEKPAYGDNVHKHGAEYTEERCGVARAEGRNNCGHWKQPRLSDSAYRCKYKSCCMLFLNNALIKWARAVKDAGYRSDDRTNEYGRDAWEYCIEHEKSCDIDLQETFDEMRREAMDTYKFTKHGLTCRHYGGYRW